MTTPRQVSRRNQLAQQVLAVAVLAITALSLLASDWLGDWQTVLLGLAFVALPSLTLRRDNSRGERRLGWATLICGALLVVLGLTSVLGLA